MPEEYPRTIEIDGTSHEVESEGDEKVVRASIDFLRKRISPEEFREIYLKERSVEDWNDLVEALRSITERAD